jgi:competence protein ComEC
VSVIDRSRRALDWLGLQGRPGQLDDVGAVVLAGAVVVGAFAAVAVPVVGAVGVSLAALASRRVALVWAAGALLASSLAAQAWTGMTPPDPAPYRGAVTLARDPEARNGGWRVEVVAGGRRFEAFAPGAAGARLSDRSAGQHVDVVGRIEPIRDMPWLTARHVVGRLVVDEVGGWREGGPLGRLANGVRSVLRRGAEPLPDDQRALFLGFVLGDDRGQPPEVADDFDAAGLQHLLVVSGQNVAFVLVVAGPLLRGFDRRTRLAATVALLVVFASVTRFEPSVLRATVMAGLAALAVALGRAASGVRVLALAVAALVVADPFLVHAVGFRLSVAASAGILFLAAPLAAAIPGPRFVVLPLAVTLAAQAGVAPVLIPTFGPMPVAAIPANLLAEPVAGLVMMWGCSAGLVAGVAGGPVAAVLQWPTGLGIGWVAAVARWAADLPLGGLGSVGVAAVAAGLGVSVLAARRGRRALATVVALLLVAVPVHACSTATGLRPEGPVEVAGGQLWVSADGASGDTLTVLVVDGTVAAAPLLAALRDRGVEEVALVVARSGGSRTAAALAALDERVDLGVVWAPPGHRIPGAVTPDPGRVGLAGLTLDVQATQPRLDVDVDVDVATDPDGSPR